MEVETFEVAEVANLDKEYTTLIQELELGGQQQLVGAAATTCPYREITTLESKVYFALMESSCDAKEYNAAAIPVKVLQIMRFAKNLGIYNRFKIHYSKYNNNAILIAGKLEPNRWNLQTWHLLARWGEKLLPFDELRKKAAAKLKTEVLLELKRIAARVAVDIKEVEESSPESVEWETPSYYFLIGTKF